MAPDPDRPARRATFVLLALAYAACEVAAYPDGRPRPFGVGFGLALFSLAVVVSYLLPGPGGRARPPRLLTAALAAVLVLPVLIEPVLRTLTDSGFPLELQLVNGLRNLGLALAAAAAWPSFRKLAAVVALFLALFASAMGDQPAIPYLLAALAGAGGVWLVLNHRAGLTEVAAGTAAGEVERVGLRLPYREAVVFGLLAVAAAGVAVAGPKRVMASLGELVPTSGGTGQYDPFARFGTGDGSEEVAGDNAKAAGMVDSDKMIEDTKDALIDAVSDMFGPPHKPPKERERMVAAGKVDVIQNHDKLAENRRPSRDFDTARKGPADGRKPDGTGPRGVIEVEGRTPLHVRVVAYDRYDSDARRWEEGRKPEFRPLVPDEDGDDWMRAGGKRSAGWYAADDRHRLKVADLKSNLVPTPAMLARVRIRRVDKPNYYAWDYDGVLALAGRRKTPPGIVVHTDCRTLDPGRLPAAAFPAGAAPELLDVPPALRPELDRLAAEWAGAVPRGWPQVEAVLARLRDGYALDRSATAPADHPAPALWFLTDSRRGPDYLFATSAALLLRLLGYPTRVCLGYYAAPAAYDPETGHTPVGTRDLHVWPEVLLSDGQWLVVEPTPGYEVLPPNRSAWERAADAAAGVGRWLARHPVPVVACVLAAAALAARRRRVKDAAFTLAWRLAPGRDWREAVLRALRLIERRGRLAGCPRPPAETLAGWAAALQARAGADPDLADLVRLGEWAAYAPALDPPAAGPVPERCRKVLSRWTVGRLAGARPAPAEGGAA